MLQIYKDRLLLLAERLERLQNEAPKRFEFSVFVGENWAGHQDLSCGTTACALGWAASMPEFQSLGMCIRDVKGRLTVGLVGDDSSDSWDSAITVARAIFDLKEAEADLLFVPSCHVKFDEEYERQWGYADHDVPDFDDHGKLGPRASAEAVARHIRNFVRASI